MFDEYELYQGAVLRRLIVESSAPVSLRPFIDEGRINAFVLNDRVGLLLKHSTKRLPPWHFTLRVAEVEKSLHRLAAKFSTYALFVCGTDGVVSLELAALRGIVDFTATDSAWIRVERKKRSMYSVSGNGGELHRKVARGTDEIFQAMKVAQVDAAR